MSGLGKAPLLLIGLLAASPPWYSARFQARRSIQQQNQSAQKSREPFTLGVEVNLVTVPVTVRKEGGGFMSDLPKSAFHITEDGEEQEILSFSEEGVGTRIAIVLDTSASVRREWDAIKSSTLKFVANFRPQDQFALVTFNTKPSSKMGWSHETGQLEKVLSSITCRDNTNLWDAVAYTINEVFKEVEEKKAMILMSDGLDNGSTISFEDALSAAGHSDAAIYVVSKTQAIRNAMIQETLKSGSVPAIPMSAFLEADMALSKLAGQTGGRVLYPGNFDGLGDVYEEVREELSHQYTLGYVSTNPSKDGTYRRIEVTVEAPGALVSARPGYYAATRTPVVKKQATEESGVKSGL